MRFLTSYEAEGVRDVVAQISGNPVLTSVFTGFSVPCFAIRKTRSPRGCPRMHGADVRLLGYFSIIVPAPAHLHPTSPIVPGA